MPLSSYEDSGKDNNYIKLPWWVILLSVLAGLVLLGLVVYALYRVRKQFTLILFSSFRTSNVCLDMPLLKAVWVMK